MSAPPQRRPTMTWRSAFIAGPAWDAAFFLGAPLLALLAGAVAGHTGADGGGPPVVAALGGAATVQALLLRTVIHAHLVIVFARSHLNRAVLRRHPVRFFVVPLALFAAMLASSSILYLGMVVVVVWDLYHSSMQTFGLGRIYDARAGAAVVSGGRAAAFDRYADVALNHAIYLGPFLCGPMLAVLVPAALGPLVTAVPAAAPAADAVLAALPAVRGIALVACAAAVVAYAAAVLLRVRRGAPLSVQKHVLYAVTAVVCAAAWGQNAFGQAFLVVNVFHAVQYFGIVSFSEKKNLAQVLGFTRLSARAATALVLLSLALFGALYGFWFGAAWERWAPAGLGQTVVLAVVNVVAVMHFWYDGFIWSVRRGDV